MPASTDRPADRRVSTIGRWARRQKGSDAEAAGRAGVSASRLADCRRLVDVLPAPILWLIDEGVLSVAHGMAIWRLPDNRERLVLAAALVHEDTVAHAPVTAGRTAAIVRERLASSGETIEEVMDRTAGLRFHQQVAVMYATEDVPSLYAAAWRWGDVTIEAYISKAPERLARLTEQINGATATAQTGAGDEPGVTVELRLALRTIE